LIQASIAIASAVVTLESTCKQLNSLSFPLSYCLTNPDTTKLALIICCELLPSYAIAYMYRLKYFPLQALTGFRYTGTVSELSSTSKSKGSKGSKSKGSKGSKSKESKGSKS
jgi:hypothetical protein